MLLAFELRDPWLLLLLLAVPLLVWVRRRARPPAIAFAPRRFLEGAPRSWRVRVLPLPRALQLAGLALGVVALARPVERQLLPPETRGLDLILCLDLSSSMKAHDLDAQRTRLDVAKEAAVRFVRGRPSDRIGLVAFARFPDLRCPPTLDHDALSKIVLGAQSVDSEGPEDATGIGAAIARAAQLLRNAAQDARVVVLLTDGEENVATAQTPAEIAPLHAAQLCEQLGVRVYTIAAGAPGADTTQVRWIAERSGGRFFEARDANALADVYASIDALETSPLGEPRQRLLERFAPFLVAAIALVIAGHLLDASVLRTLP